MVEMMGEAMGDSRWMDHTADVGAELRADDLPGLFGEALDALVAIMMTDPPRSAAGEHRLELEAPTLEGLLVRWLEEWVFRVQTERRVPVRAAIAVGATGGGSRCAPDACGSGAVTGWTLSASVRETPLDPAAHGWQSEVKGVTYHGLRVERTAAEWTAAIVFDV